MKLFMHAVYHLHDHARTPFVLKPPMLFFVVAGAVVFLLVVLPTVFFSSFLLHSSFKESNVVSFPCTVSACERPGDPAPHSSSLYFLRGIYLTSDVASGATTEPTTNPSGYRARQLVSQFLVLSVR